MKGHKANVSDIHQWADGKKYQKTTDGWREISEEDSDTSIADAHVKSIRERIAGWLSENNMAEAKGKTRDEIFTKFGNDLEVIGFIHPDYLQHLDNTLTDNSVYCGKGYFIDHAINSHPEVQVVEYENLQEVLSTPDEVKIDKRNPDRASLIFIKKYNNYFQEVISVGEDIINKDKLVVHKTYHYKQKLPHKNLSNAGVIKKSSVNGLLTISPASEDAAAVPRSISGLDANANIESFIELNNSIKILP